MDRLKEVNKLLKEMERYTGKKIPPVTEAQLNAEIPSQEEWDKAMRGHTGSRASCTDSGTFPHVGLEPTQEK